MRERMVAEDSLAYTIHQLKIYEEKAWDVVYQNGLNPEFQTRRLRMIKRRIDDLFEDRDRLIHRLYYLNVNLDFNEKTVWFIIEVIMPLNAKLFQIKKREINPVCFSLWQIDYIY